MMIKLIQTFLCYNDGNISVILNSDQNKFVPKQMKSSNKHIIYIQKNVILTSK